MDTKEVELDNEVVESKKEVHDEDSDKNDSHSPLSMCEIESMTVVDEVEDESDVKTEPAETNGDACKESELNIVEGIGEKKEDIPNDEKEEKGDVAEGTEEVNNKKRKIDETDVLKEDDSGDNSIPAKKKTLAKEHHNEKRDENDVERKDSKSRRSTVKSNEVKSEKINENDSRSKGKAAKEKVDAKPKEEKKMPLMEKYWKAVTDDPSDFTSWTYLLQYVDQENKIEAAVKVYDDFLSRYPYCYGYWRKYADFLKRNQHTDKCEEVFEKGITAIPLSIDLWIHYINYVKSNYPNDMSKIRALFEKATAVCGMEFRSDRLWDAYVKWETEIKELQNVTKIFDRWLAIPTQGYVSVMDKFKDHVLKNSPSKLVIAEEYFLLWKEAKESSDVNEDEGNGFKLLDDAPPGEETPDNIELSEKESDIMKEKIISGRKELHKETTTAVQSRWTFEEGIKRPYFHVKPLENYQLVNWNSYLDFEIENGDQNRIILLFERCLIACAMYEEFWKKYTDYLCKIALTEETRKVYTRACTIHHPKSSALHMSWANFEEAEGNRDKASEVLDKLEKEFPKCLPLILHKIYLERRRGNLEKCCTLFEQYRQETDDDVSANLCIRHARFCTQFLDDYDKAINILKESLEKYKGDAKLKIYLNLIDTLIRQKPLNIDEVSDVIDKAMSEDDGDIFKKVVFSQRKLEFLEEFSEDCTRIQEVRTKCEEYLKQYSLVGEPTGSAEESKKENDAPPVESSNGTVANNYQVPTATQAPLPSGGTYPTQYPTAGYVQGPYQQPQAYAQQADASSNYQGYPNWQATYGQGYNQSTWTGAPYSYSSYQQTPQ